jgi:hypothetical protein
MFKRFAKAFKVWKGRRVMATQQARKTATSATREPRWEAKGASLASEQVGSRDESVNERIRKRAYLLAEAAGFPEGRAEEFWLRAEKEIR